MKKIMIFISVILLLISCDEINKIINPPADEYLIDKTVSLSTNEQIIESGNDFKMIIPANSLKGDLELKIKKESSYPTFSESNTKLGNNIFRIKFSGDADFLKPVNIMINYDKSAIPVGKTVQESVFGYIYSKGAWKLADYQLEEPNGKIIISISSIIGKTNKDEPILLDDGEIIIGDGYTTTDSGDNDFFLAKYKYLSMLISNGAEYDIEPNNGGGGQWGTSIVSGIERPLIQWNGNLFTYKIVKEHLGLTEIVEINGEAKQIGTDEHDGLVTIIKLSLYASKISSVNYVNMEYSCVIENLKLKIPTNPDLPYHSCFVIINGNEISKYVSDVKEKIHSEDFDNQGNLIKAWDSYAISYFFRESDQLTVGFSTR